jgi:hypothetical protein
MTKLLKIVFVILLLVTIGEAGYYIYILRFAGSSNYPAALFPGSAAITPTVILPPSSYNTKSIENHFLESPILDTVERTGKRSGQKVSLVYEQEGVINTIFFQEGNPNPSINIFDNDGKRIVTIIGNQNVEFMKKMDGEERVMDFKDLKEGDKIVIREVTDLLNNRTKNDYIIYPEND